MLFAGSYWSLDANSHLCVLGPSPRLANRGRERDPTVAATPTSSAVVSRVLPRP